MSRLPMLKRIINILQLRREERIPTAIAFVYFAILNIVNVCAYWTSFKGIGVNYHKLFVSQYHVSGFDPLTYQVISDWFPAYNIYRHPLLAFFMYPFYLVNKALMWLTGCNCTTILTAMILVFCATYSFVFLYRILRNVIGITRYATYALTALYFSFGYVIVSSFAPDHFVMSQCSLLLVLWLSGEKLKRGSALNMWQTIALFTITAGVSLNNGLKVFLAALTTRCWRFFRPGYLVLAVLLPSAIIWGIARWEYKVWQLPPYKARIEVKARKDREATERIRKAVADTISVKTDSAINVTVKRIRNERAAAKYRADHKKIWNINKGKPLMNGEFMEWTDISNSRMDAFVHNLFGEGLQLHRDHLLCDALRSRPLIVKYSGGFAPVNYVVEGLILLLFAAGIWCGRRSRFFWTTMSFFLMDMALHMGLGFGLNEIYIMSAHYLFALPIATAFVIKACGQRKAARQTATGLVALLALWCLAWNLTLIISFFS